MENWFIYRLKSIYFLGVSLSDSYSAGNIANKQSQETVGNCHLDIICSVNVIVEFLFSLFIAFYSKKIETFERYHSFGANHIRATIYRSRSWQRVLLVKWSQT